MTDYYRQDRRSFIEITTSAILSVILGIIFAYWFIWPIPTIPLVPKTITEIYPRVHWEYINFKPNFLHVFALMGDIVFTRIAWRIFAREIDFWVSRISKMIDHVQKARKMNEGIKQ